MIKKLYVLEVFIIDDIRNENIMDGCLGVNGRLAMIVMSIFILIFI